MVLAQERDVRNVGAMQEESLRNIRTWCREAGSVIGEAACNSSALSSLFWGGENLPDAAFTFCALAEEGEKQTCYTELTNQIVQYLGGEYRAQSLCERLPDSYQADCVSRIF